MDVVVVLMCDHDPFCEGYEVDDGDNATAADNDDDDDETLVTPKETGINGEKLLTISAFTN